MPMQRYVPARLTAAPPERQARAIVERNHEGGLAILLDGSTPVPLALHDLTPLVRSLLRHPETACVLAALCSADAIGMQPGLAAYARESIMLAHVHAAAESAAGWYEMEHASARDVRVAGQPSGVTVSERTALALRNLSPEGKAALRRLAGDGESSGRNGDGAR